MIVATLSGLFGGIIMNLFNVAMKHLKQTTWNYAQLDASWVLYWFRVKRKTSLLLGQVINSSISSALGVPILYMLKKPGTKHSIYKGVVSGIVIWLVLFVLPSKRNMFSIKSYYAKTHFVALISGIIYGISTVWAILNFANLNQSK
jgi:hypothetical protein